MVSIKEFAQNVKKKFGIRVSNNLGVLSVPLALPSGAATVVLFKDADSKDPDRFHDVFGVPANFVIPEEGDYLVGCELAVAILATTDATDKDPPNEL